MPFVRGAGKVDGSKAGQIAVIARANLTLFNTAVEIVCNGHYRELGLTHVNGAFVGVRAPCQLWCFIDS